MEKRAPSLVHSRNWDYSRCLRLAEWVQEFSLDFRLRQKRTLKAGTRGESPLIANPTR